MTVGEMIKQTRIEGNLTQEEYGLKFGVTRQTVSSWENERSLPDLQMLIDICNTYDVSLDRLLNEDKNFVNKIDFYSKFRKIIMSIAVLVIIALVIFAAVFVRWKIISTDMNEAFAGNAKQMGFVLEDGKYILKENDVYFRLPNQKLPFLKEDFFVKNSYADFKIGDTEIEITIYEDSAFRIEMDRYRFLEGTIDKNGIPAVEENTLSTEEKVLYEENNAEITEILKRLWVIHYSVYV